MRRPVRAIVTSMISSRMETEICDKFKINALTEPQKCSMSAVTVNVLKFRTL